ncbi:UDP-N-acetylmuramoylalanine--D-glutamate ligase [Oryzisolibacter propanilivorax]|uniref:UDP-N-acetylmuramoylalanine--D-glutamate ligase n=1 Tax=Oryzisolibacter propanilivorax TaxID=1527607 RepID=A0A1G9RQG0_9BURK|nr:UDP-N-acetylmuramoyl-L-alanine--D-glutamate ligase [Oryzisolibacter propanilivorax]SDM25374.1 UDP-N-acetylmuramoylalanine--D-glutamate ligase [Oryzisolibacter propanilivorax]
MNDERTPPTPPDTAPMAAPALNAAAEAAQFVARLFAEVRAEEAPQPDAGTPAALDGAAPAAAPGVDAAPAASVVAPRQALDGLLQGQQVLVLGLGDSGLAMARWCARCGAAVTVADTRAAPPQLAALQAELPQARFVAGPFCAALGEAEGLTAVYRSPGLTPVEVAPVLEAAGQRGIRAGGELDLFSEALTRLRAACAYAPAVLAVTGTNGKTTVTALTHHLLQHAGRNAAVAGNIGPSLLDTLSERLDAGDLPDAWVLELSSFQLDAAHGFEPGAATVLNLTQDHLDWHGDMQAYGAVKARIFGQQALMVLNRDDPAVMAMLPAPERVAGARGRPATLVRRAHVTFGADLPRRPGDFGIEVAGGMAWLVRAHEADETAQRGRAARAGTQEELHLQRLMPEGALRIRGRHNATNALAALALAQAAGCPLSALLYGLREYRGEPHRVEPVAIVQDVEYFDDSKGTNVGATVAALNGLGAEHRLIVILGGDGKGQDFAPLAAPLARHARAALLIGRDAPRIRAALQDCGVPLMDAATLEGAVRQAAARAHAGDAVLLSPACASWDMFNGYAHRAQVFRDAVQALAEDAGQPFTAGGLA